MKMSRSTHAKIVNHDSGLGTPTPDTVRKRACELARIDGRARFTDEDWRQAQRELQGGQSLDPDDDAPRETISFHDMTATDKGHHVENMPVEDAGNMVEELIAEGMDEAVHEQMLAAARREVETAGEED
jgi:hypothetical protein